MNRPPCSPTGPDPSPLSFLLGSLMAAGSLVWCLSGPGTLVAADWSEGDLDLDGIPDRQEAVLGTDPFVQDTDADGFTDGEEFALQTSPTDRGSFPEKLGLSVGMTARGEGNEVRVFVAILDPDSNLKNNSVRFSLLMGGRIFELNPGRSSAVTTGETIADIGGSLYLMDFEVPTSAFRVYDQLTYCVAIGREGSSRYVSADKVDIFLDDSVIALRRILSDPGNSPDPSIIQVPGTTVHQPIPPQGDGGIPIDWNPGQICYQETQIVGTSGAVVEHEVISADCVEGWDTYCATDCSGTVGSSYETIDTGVLLGG